MKAGEAVLYLEGRNVGVLVVHLYSEAKVSDLGDAAALTAAVALHQHVAHLEVAVNDLQDRRSSSSKQSTQQQRRLLGGKPPHSSTPVPRAAGVAPAADSAAHEVQQCVTVMVTLQGPACSPATLPTWLQCRCSMALATSAAVSRMAA